MTSSDAPLWKNSVDACETRHARIAVEKRKPSFTDRTGTEVYLARCLDCGADFAVCRSHNTDAVWLVEERKGSTYRAVAP